MRGSLGRGRHCPVSEQDFFSATPHRLNIHCVDQTDCETMHAIEIVLERRRRFSSTVGTRSRAQRRQFSALGDFQ